MPVASHESVDTQETGAAVAPVLLLTAWHLKRMRSMPRGFYRVRQLDFATRGEPGCLWVHRWISRRSLMLTTAWTSEEAAHRWLAGPSFARTAEAFGAIEGSVVRLEQYDHGITLDVPDASGA